MQATLSHLAHLVNGTLKGEATCIVQAMSSIDSILPGSLVFAENPTALARAEASDAVVAIVVNQKTQSQVKPVIQVASPFKAFVQLLDHYYPPICPEVAIHPTAVIAPDAMLGKGVTVGAYVTIESGSRIGDYCVIKNHISIGHHVTLGTHCVLHPHVTLYDNTQLGSHVSIHAGSVIGSDGFGYQFVDGEHVKFPHIGRVIIEDHVEIGANTVVDRASMGATVIGKGTKIDNLVQIAHSVQLGQHNILCAFTGVAGSTSSGDRVIFAANVGVSDHVRIDDDVVLAARAGVPPGKHLLHGNVYLGSPARPREKAIELELATTRISGMRKQLKKLSEQVGTLTERMESLEASDV